MIAQSAISATAASSLLEVIQNKVPMLAPDQQQQVLDFVEFLAQKNQTPAPKQSIWDMIDEHMARLPDEVWENMPTDGSYQHDHYLYGTPKREL
jgi:hypothetical protein